jgi:hypothetical protein
VRGFSQRPSRKRSHQREPGAHAHPGAGKQSGSKGKRRQGDAVDEAEHDEGEAEHTNAGRTAGVAADDRDPHRIVEAAGKGHSDQRSATVAGCECKRLGALIAREQSSPAVGLEGLSE